jgi:3-dehydroquinate dehydratase-2
VNADQILVNEGEPLLDILVLQGPNLNLLGRREPTVYGDDSLNDVQVALDALAKELGVQLTHFQSNLEGELIQSVQEVSVAGFSGALVNAGGFTHTSVALRDAFSATRLPFVEVHISHVLKREPFRHQSLLADLSVGLVMGFGIEGYCLGLRGLTKHLQSAV